MELVIHLPDALGKRLQALPDPDDFIRQALENALATHGTEQRAATLQAVQAFKPFLGKRPIADIIREEREQGNRRRP